VVNHGLRQRLGKGHSCEVLEESVNFLLKGVVIAPFARPRDLQATRIVSYGGVKSNKSCRASGRKEAQTSLSYLTARRGRLYP